MKGNVLRNEPVMIQSLVQAILGLFLAFGVSLSNEQVGSIMAVTAVILALLARMFVTPTSKTNGSPADAPAEPPPANPV
jgi:hypothetical protein